MQFGLSATASLPGFELAGTLTTDSSKSGKPGEGGTGFEALLAALVAGNANGQTNLNIDTLELDGVTPETQDIVDALASMAQTLVPLADAFNNLQFPTADQLTQARDALGKLAETINNHPNRPELSFKGSIGSFAAQLSELRKAEIDVGKEAASDFAKVGNLLERLDKLLSQMPGGTPAQGQQNASTNASLNIQQMIDRLNHLAEKLPTLPAQFEAQLKSQTLVGNSIFDAQAKNIQPAMPVTDQKQIDRLSHLAEKLPTLPAQFEAQLKSQTLVGNSIFDAQSNQTETTKQSTGNGTQIENARTAGTTISNNINIVANSQAQLEQDPNKPAAQTTAAQQSASTATTSPDAAKSDILAQLATLGQQANPEMKKPGGPTATSSFADVAANAEAELPTTKMNFAQVTREAHLQTAMAYPDMQKGAQAATAAAPLPTELDAVETGTEKLLGQHKIETFNQQINHIDAAKAQTSGRQINMPGLAFEIVRQFRAGQQRFDVRLDPPEMGRIDVRMEVDGNNVTAHMRVERPETLDLLQRDARALERALQQAGLNTDRADLQFSLKQDGQGSSPNFENQGHEQGNTRSADLNASLDDQSQLSETTVYRGTTGPGGLNLWV